MSAFSPSGGVNEREPTLIGEAQLHDCEGAEYRVGEMGIFVARGRDLVGTVTSATGKGLYEAGFDGNAGYVIAHEGNSLHYAPIAATLAFTYFDGLPTGSSAIVGTHYANRHYLATGVANRRLESGVTSFPIGMSAATVTLGNSVTGGVGTISATTGLEYWVTEYDSTRGIESIAGSTTNTGAFSLKDGIIVNLFGTSQNPRADTWRWYRSTDGGGFPDGGLIRETAIGVTTITDTLSQTGSLTVPNYGVVSIGGVDYERDEAPPIFSTIFGPFQNSLMAVSVAEPRVLRFTPDGYPDSWPSGYQIPFDTERRDEILGGVVLPGRVAVFCKDSVHVIYRLPRDSDSIFAAGEMQESLTLARGSVSRRGHAVFTPPGSGAYVIWVSRDGIWASTLTASPLPVTDKIDWEGRVNVSLLSECELIDDPVNRRLIFIHRKATDTTHNTGLWYLDYQEFGEMGIRITFADHGPLASGTTIAATDGSRRVVSFDSRASNGQVYLESTQDVDDSNLLDSSGSVRFRIRTKEFIPAGPRAALDLGDATIMHGAGPSRIEHRFYFDRRDDFPEFKLLPDPDIRTASTVVLQRSVNSVNLEIQSVGTISYGVHWIDIKGLDTEPLAAREGA